MNWTLIAKPKLAVGQVTINLHVITKIINRIRFLIVFNHPEYGNTEAWLQPHCSHSREESPSETQFHIQAGLHIIQCTWRVASAPRRS
ncbi:hypothetical protein BC938DRAFT_481966 [Jimgerdemannia flammicorona]|uniref:Uncharacterized protein n=1 Tax=Jimgerdemannia flammicorona TaxID=994334 RepID=A0A433QF02_9FUNG|nr:hypothetical protein BC938DRAFT_481966 [Jimgerdemannia flammicorona]